MINIAIENNLSETAFIVKQEGNYKLRWFTPGGEIDLCGHATLASAFVIMNYIDTDITTVVFNTISGGLVVNKKGDSYEMNFLVYTLQPAEVTDEMILAIGATPNEAYMGRDLLCIFENENIIKELKSNLEKLKQLEGRSLHVTAPGDDVDCVSRTFAPKLNVSKDPVCGSGHCNIIPYWAKNMKKNNFVAYQASKRGGTLYYRIGNNGVFLTGKAVLYSIADIFI